MAVNGRIISIVTEFNRDDPASSSSVVTYQLDPPVNEPEKVIVVSDMGDHFMDEVVAQIGREDITWV